jgi:predicted P-loop ATPase
MSNIEWPDFSKRRLTPRNSYGNCLIAIERLGLKGSHDVFSDRRYIWGPNLPKTQLNDDIKEQIRDQIENTFGFEPGKENTIEALMTFCEETEEHPLLDYFNTLVWDGTPRIQNLFHQYFGAEDSKFNQEISTITMVAAIRLIKHPGTKFGNIPVLEGPQGNGKTDSLHILAGNSRYVRDYNPLGLDIKTRYEMLPGAWIYELSQLSSMSERRIAKLQAFVSTTYDSVRPPYGHFTTDRPRHTLFIGTTNEDDYLRYGNKNHRFWPVKTTKIDLPRLQHDRDQLWAEAIVLEQAGHSIVLDDSFWPAAKTPHGLKNPH